ncbi:BRO-N domain-containing protein [Cytobacillus horneckiae]|uniref:BRO-N domain-containing protein n=1 Tax=Cytobacillus horneckiae TaxID=549687 RepID=UPI003D9A80BF
MNQLTNFNHAMFGELPVIIINDIEWFGSTEAAKALSFSNPYKAIDNHVEPEDCTVHTVLTNGGNQNKKFINESGLYSLIIGAAKQGNNKEIRENAKKFKRWVTSEVLPSIRKKGSYQIVQPQTHLEVLQGAINQMVEQDKRMNQLEGQVNNISNIVSMSNVGWREKVKVILRKIAKNWTGVEPYRSVINLSYERLEERAGCKLDLRLNNRKERAIAQGMNKSYVSKINKLDVIAEEKRLVEIYIQVIKEMAIQFRVNINDFEEVI